MRKVPGLKMSQPRYDAARLLSGLWDDIGFQRFGLVIQALFAHVLLRLGGEVLDVRNPGHPDISAILAGQLHNIEVETVKRKTVPRRLESGDLQVLQVNRDGVCGYYCVLDCGPPISWLCVDVASLGHRADEQLHLSLLRGYCDKDFSIDCTSQFSHLVTSEAGNLRRFTYAQLRREALHGRYR